MGEVSGIDASDFHDDSTTFIDLVRHGRVATPGLFCASTDEPLSETGWEQLTATTKTAQVDQVITSSSRRCAEFAQHFAQELGLPLQTINGFQEMHFGDWIGLSAADIWQKDATLLRTLWESPQDFTAPNGESMLEFAERIEHSWHELLTQYGGKRLLVFTHAGVIRVLLAQALGVPYKNTTGFDLAYGSAVRMRVYEDGVVSVYGLGVRDLS